MACIIMEFIVFILTLFPLTSFIYLSFKRSNLRKWLPAMFCLTITFACSNIEAFKMLETTFNFAEHLFSMLIGVSFLGGALLEYISSISKKNNPIKSKNIGGHK